jgi:hypothetical protein
MLSHDSAQLRNLGEEDIHHIPIEFLDNGVLSVKHGVFNLIRAIHFDPNVPQNNNIRPASKKYKIVEVWENNKWTTKARCDIVECLVTRYKCLLYERFVVLLKSGKITYEDSITINKAFSNFMTSNAYFTCSQKITALLHPHRG